MSEFDHNTNIHIVIPAWQWDEMYTIWKEYKNQGKVKGQPGKDFEDTNWFKLHVNG